MAGEEITKVKNQEQSKVIDWSKVLTNAISLLVATVFVGAAATLWNQGDQIKQDVSAALEVARETTEGLRLSQGSIFATQHEFSHEIARLTLALDALREQLEQFAEALPDNVKPDLPATGATDGDEPKKWFPVRQLGPREIESESERIIKDIQRLQRGINPRQRIAPE